MPAQAPDQGPKTANELVPVLTDQALAKPEAATDIALAAYAEGRDLERIVAEITIPPDFQYVITKNVKDDRTNQWHKEVAKVGITADGYEYLNRALGASFWFPKWVHDEQGEPKRNPIHRPDYIYLRIGIVYYNPLGQRISTIEDVEVDFKLMYQDKRANARSAKPLLGQNGELLWDEAGNPGLVLSPEDEMKCLRELTRSRAFGPRYASTVGRVRLLKLATGLRSLPAVAAGHSFKVKMVAYRDRLSPEQRVAEAAQTLGDIYGDGGSAEAETQSAPPPVNLTPLTAEEQMEVGLSEELHDDDATAMEQQHVAEARANEDPGDRTPSPGEPVTRAWTPEEIADIEAEQADQ